jgi:hypothetical protein
MATPTGEVTTVLTYGDMKQTFESLPARSHISQDSWEYIREIYSRRLDEYAQAFLGNWGESPVQQAFNPHEGQRRVMAGWCMPSREGLYTAFQIPSKHLQDSPPTPVEEDSVFAPREVEVVCGNSS